MEVSELCRAVLEGAAADWKVLELSVKAWTHCFEVVG